MGFAQEESAQETSNPQARRFVKKLKLGEKWKCGCGDEHELKGAYLAAHWNDELKFKCDCGTEYCVKSGVIKELKGDL